MTEVWLQISAGRGPVECAWAVMQTLLRLEQEAQNLGLTVTTLEIEAGSEKGTAQSALISLRGEQDLSEFLRQWLGTVQWIAKSPFRAQHRRKNWFVGIEALRPVEERSFNLTEVKIETMRASGPGGQHVNRTESAVRVTHVPSGVQATAAEERSQHLNRKLALARLAQRLADLEAKQHDAAREQRWRNHQAVERGNPVRTFWEGGA